MTHDPSAIELRPALPEDAQACRMLLSGTPQITSALVAVEGGRVVGAAGLVGVFRKKPPVGPGAAVHVIPPCRRRGIGRRLVDTLLAEAASAGADALYGARRAPLDSEEQRGWEWLGFSVLERVQDHEISTATILDRLSPLLAQMNEQGWVPASARVVRLCDADFSAVASLHMSLLGGNAENLTARMRCETPDGFHPEYSTVLLVDGRVCGCVLARRRSEDSAIVDANLLEPDLHGGWANILLKTKASEKARSLGIEKFIYETFDQYDDTRKFSEMLGGRVVAERVLMHRLIDGPPGP